MKIILGFLLLVLNLSPAFAATIVEVIPGDRPEEDFIVKWSDGRVTFVNPSQAPTIEKAHFSVSDSMEPMLSSYEPTVMESDEAVQKLLKTMRSPSPFQFNIQCYNIAHVRAYEAWKNHGVKSTKMFLFFTKSYIRKHGSKWWFHVTPMVHVNVDGKIQERILDKEWLKGPSTTKLWTDKFIKTKKHCPVISKYSSYENNQDTNDCYVYPVSMYYWQPLHLIELEESRVEHAEFNMRQVNTAYARDF